MEIQIRPARSADFGGVHSLLTQIDRLHAELHPERFTYAPKGQEEWRNLQLNLDDPDREMLLAFDDHGLVGLAFLHIERAPDLVIFQPGEWVLLDILTVDEGQRGRGIGRELLGASRAWAESRGLREIQLTVYNRNPARDVYRRWGFEPIKETMRLNW
ncbi:MAG: GNAT family N-acetyltransferase [Bacteroidota bacterium]